MNRINFLPERIKRKRHSARQVRRHVFILAVLAVLLAAMGTTGQMKLNAAEVRLGTYEKQLADLSQRLEVVPQLQKQIADGRIKSRISDEVGSSVPVTKLLVETARLLPEGACLTSLDLSAVSAVSPTTARPGAGIKASRAEAVQRVMLKLTGLTPSNVDLAGFMGALTNSPMFEDIRLGYSRTVPVDGGNREACSFEVTCVVAQ